MTGKAYTVTQVSRYIKRLLEDDALLGQFFIEGECSNVHYHQSGHVYFTLKDEQATINAVLFKSHAGRLPFTLKNGMRVVALGYVSLYEKTGQYQFYAEDMEPYGIGRLQIAFNQLREKMAAEGWFDPERKRPIPAYAACVAVITSLTGAALQDILRIAHNRNPAIKLIIAPALVQGEGASADIARAVAEVNAYASYARSKGMIAPEVIILGRGGGSIEDLWAFNEEATVRAVALSELPIISAVGHETDFTLTDFCADYRAPTPSAAAATAVYNRGEVISHITDGMGRMYRALRVLHTRGFNRLTEATGRRFFRRPLEQLYMRQEYIVTLTKTLQKIITHHHSVWQARLERVSAALAAGSPERAWANGFTLVTDKTGRRIRSALQVMPGDTVYMRWASGGAEANIISVSPEVYNHAPFV
jgi:exodeoxyribonuclease VII large subunit